MEILAVTPVLSRRCGGHLAEKDQVMDKIALHHIGAPGFFVGSGLLSALFYLLPFCRSWTAPWVTGPIKLFTIVQVITLLLLYKQHAKPTMRTNWWRWNWNLHGGNDWHYHNSFEEQFTVVEGQVKIGKNGQEIVLEKGQTAMADKTDMHYFKNALDQKSILLVKVTPAAGLEKTLRVAYGLINDGLLKNDMTENPWHMCLLLAYSESYLPGMPNWFQEPLINALAKIAQWKGEDKSLYKYFM